MEQPKDRWILYHAYPALGFLVFFAAGIGTGWILLGEIARLPLLPAVATLWFCALVLSAVRSSAVYFLYGLNIFMLGVTALFTRMAVHSSDSLSGYSLDSLQAFSGRITEARYGEQGRNRFILSCDSVYCDAGNRFVNGSVLLYQGRFKGRIRTGDRIRIQDSPRLPPLPNNPGSFNYRRYLQLKGVYYQYYIYDTTRVDVCRFNTYDENGWIAPDSLKAEMIRRIEHWLRPPASHLLLALLLGVKHDMDREIVHDFQMTGIVHVLAISGLHVGFIILIFHLFFSVLRFPHLLKTFSIIAGLLGYVVLVDYKISVVRAAIMAGGYLFSSLVQRQVKSLNTLGGAGLLILSVMPHQLLMPGFQFSFLAVGSILYGYPELNRVFPDFKKKEGLLFPLANGTRQAFLVSLAATLGTLPLTWFYYGYLPLGGVFLNLLIIPLIGVLVCAGFLFLFLSLIPFMPLEGFAQLISWYTEGIVRFVGIVAEIPGLTIFLPGGRSWILIPLFILVILLFNIRYHIPRYILYVSIILTSIVLSFRVLIHSAGHLDIWYLDVGQGDAAVIRTPDKETIVIDAGEIFGMDRGEKVVLPVLRHLGVSHIDYLIGTHGHSDHIGGIISVLSNICVDTLVLSPYPMNSKLYARLLAETERYQVPVRYAIRGDILSGVKGIRLYVLHPFSHYTEALHHSGEEVNNSSVVIQIQYRECRFLFTGDLEKSAEPELLGYGDFLESEVLKAGHHGSRTSTTEPFLDAVGPEYCIVSVGTYNRFNHPSPLTLFRVWKRGIAVLRTDMLGALHFRSDGRRVRLENWRTAN